MALPVLFRQQVARLQTLLQGRWHWLVALSAGLVWLTLVSLPGSDSAIPEVVGAAPAAWDPALPGNEPTVQVRVALTHLPATEDGSLATRTLAQPSATTLFGTAAAIEQTVRLTPLHDIDVMVRATPRPALAIKAADGQSTLVLDEELEVVERRRTWWGFGLERVTLLNVQVVHYDATRRVHRVAFVTGGQAFHVEVSAIVTKRAETTPIKAL